jgi:hypothetical protein
MDDDGSNKRKLPIDDVIPMVKDYPSWSKDGNKILYRSYPATLQLVEEYPHLVGLWVLDLRTNEHALLIKLGMISHWGKDRGKDSKITFSSRHIGHYSQIFIADVVEVPDFDLASILAGMIWVLFVGISLGLTLIYIAVIVRGKLRRRDER